MTITYALHACAQGTSSACLQPSSLPLHQALAIALQDPSFPPEGRALGFACQCLYPYTSNGLTFAMLKGPNAAIVAAAENLGLGVQLIPVWRPEYRDGREGRCYGFMPGPPDKLPFQVFSPSNDINLYQSRTLMASRTGDCSGSRPLEVRRLQLEYNSWEFVLEDEFDEEE